MPFTSAWEQSLRFFFATTKLERLYTKEQGARSFPKAVIEAFFDVMGVIAAAKDERDLRNSRVSIMRG